MEKANIYGKIIVIMKENGRIIRFMDWELIIGLMGEDIQDNGEME